MSYSKILNPKTNRLININSRMGKSVIKKYCNALKIYKSKKFGGTSEITREQSAVDCHFEKTFKIQKQDAKLIFFDKKYENEWNIKYTNLIKNTPIIESKKYNIKWNLIIENINDNTKNEYQIQKHALNINYSEEGEEIDKKNPIKFFDHRKDLLTKTSRINLLRDNNLSPKILMTNELFDELITNNKSIKYYFVPIYKEVNVITWSIFDMLENDYVVICIINDIIVGRVVCNILKDNNLEAAYTRKDIMHPNMNLYIANVDVHPSFQGKGLCRPLLSYAINILKMLGYKMLFIKNWSESYGGLPACICYYKSGIENNYSVKYADRGINLVNRDLVGFKEMTNTSCSNIPHPSNYYYVLN